MKRLFDAVAAFSGLVVMSPVLLIFVFLIWIQDFHFPFYVAPRVGRGGKMFRMIKLRSMIVGADKSGVDSTSKSDDRITWVGHIIRRYKLDEFSQLWNVLIGDMSLVGPRPNIEREVGIYTKEERGLLEVKPGITDLASIVFSDEGEILSGSHDPDIEYNQVIRPWKSRLGLLYVEKRSLMLDVFIIGLTVIAILSRSLALSGVQKILEWLGADPQLRRVALRQEPLQPFPPPGSDRIVASRHPSQGQFRGQVSAFNEPRQRHGSQR